MFNKEVFTSYVKSMNNNNKMKTKVLTTKLK